MAKQTAAWKMDKTVEFGEIELTQEEARSRNALEV